MKRILKTIGIIILLIILSFVCADGASDGRPLTATPVVEIKSPKAAGEMVNAPMAVVTATVTPTLRVVQIVAPKAHQVILAWDAPTIGPVSGYKIYWGGKPGIYTNSVNAGPWLAATVTNLMNGKTYYFVARTYDELGKESAPSNEVFYTIPIFDVYGVSVQFIASSKSGGPFTNVYSLGVLGTGSEITVTNTEPMKFFSSRLDIWKKP